MNLAADTPDGYKPDPKVMKWAEKNPDFTWTTSPAEAIKDADVVLRISRQT